jgi:DNA-directed RNA polymerase specialized sigma24 family protein
MQAVDQVNGRIADLYWLAYLLTGQSEPSLDLAIEAMEEEDREGGFFSQWMLAWSRRVVIAKALAAIRGELAQSAVRTEAERGGRLPVAPPNWVLDRGTSKLQLEAALLDLDVFPRCAVLLSVFEGMSLEDAATLLDVDRNLVRKGQAAGLRELTRKLARNQSHSQSRDTKGFVITGETQYA